MVDAGRKYVRTQVTSHGLLDVDSLEVAGLICLCCSCTCFAPAPASAPALADWAGRQAGGHTLPKHARRFASATVEFQALVCSTDDVQTLNLHNRLAPSLSRHVDLGAGKSIQINCCRSFRSFGPLKQ